MTIEKIREQFSANGWTITKDTTGRVGQRIIEGHRVVDGVATCVGESAEVVSREYDRRADRWNSTPTGEMRKPHLRPCFAPGVIG